MSRRYTQSPQPSRVQRGLWPMAAEPGPNFRWGVLLRTSQPKRVKQPDGTVLLVEQSTDRQDLELIGHITSNRMGIIVESYKDVASAWKPGAKRPRYKHALVDLASGYIDGIAVLAVDRLTRRRDQTRPILNALEEMGGRLFALWDELDTASDDPDTELRLYELVARAEREAIRTSKRYTLAAQHRAKKGLHQPGSKRPYGHTEDWSKLVDEEVKLIREAADRILKREGATTITKDWQRRGIPSAAGGRWHPEVLKNILLSPRMVAKRQYGETLFELKDVPAVLDEETWKQVCDVLNKRATSFSVGPRAQRLVSGIMRCTRCELTVVGNTNVKGQALYADKRRHREEGACGGIAVLAEPVDKLVGEKAIEFLNDTPRVATLLERYRMEGPEMDAIDARYAELQENKMALEEAAFNPPPGVPRLPKERFWALRADIEHEQEQLQRRRVVSREALPLKEALKETWTVESWEARPVEWKRTILKLICERIDIEPRGRGGPKGGRNFFDPDRVKVKFAVEVLASSGQL